MRRLLIVAPRTASFTERARWGAIWGAMFGISCSVVATAQVILQGTAVLTRSGFTYGTAIALYMLACPVSGVVVGALLPLARWRAGSMVVGFLAVLCMGSVIAIVSLSGQPWARVNSFVVLVGALSLGVPTGIAYHRMFGDALDE